MCIYYTKIFNLSRKLSRGIAGGYMVRAKQSGAAHLCVLRSSQLWKREPTHSWTFWRTYHPQSHWIQLLSGAVCQQEATSNFTFERSFIFTLVFQPVWSSESWTHMLLHERGTVKKKSENWSLLTPKVFTHTRPLHSTQLMDNLHHSHK